MEDGSTGFDWRMMHDTERQLVTPDPAWAKGLAGISAPTLVVSGTRSPFDPDVAARIPGAALVRIEAGHLVHVEARKEFLDAVDAFLDASHS
ncbi:alpha/beta fold hydrolase [Nonomuraea antimicrobica]